MERLVSPIPLSMNVRPKVVLPSTVEEKAPDNGLSDVLDALRTIEFPAPIVQPPDLSDIVTAVTSLKPGPTAAEIAAAIADVLTPSVSEDQGTPLREVAEALRNLDFRMQGMGRQAYGGGAVHIEPGQSIGVSGPVAVSNQPTDLKVHDDYQTGEVLADQTGAAGVLTFTFSAAVSLVVVDANGAVTDIARADPFGGTPTATLGIPCRDEAPTYMPVTTSSVKVYAPTAMVVSCYGYRRT